MFPATTVRARRAVAAVLVAAAAGCGPAEDVASDRGAITVEDGSGRALALDAPARRVVSMMPSVTEWVIALGAADRLVARTDYDDDPAIAHLPSVGGGLTPGVEWLAAREPDLVIAWPDAPSRSLVARLEALGIPVYTAPSETIAEALDVAADLGRLLGLESAAVAAVAAVRHGLDSVRIAVADRPPPDVLFLIGLDPLTAAGPGTFIDELVTVAGGRNVLEGTPLRWPQLSVEEAVTRAPDVVIVGSVATGDVLARLRARPGLRDLPAAGTGRVHTVDPDIVNRPGPRLHESAALLARLIHDGDEPGPP